MPVSHNDQNQPRRRGPETDKKKRPFGVGWILLLCGFISFIVCKFEYLIKTVKRKLVRFFSLESGYWPAMVGKLGCTAVMLVCVPFGQECSAFSFAELELELLNSGNLFFNVFHDDVVSLRHGKILPFQCHQGFMKGFVEGSISIESPIPLCNVDSAEISGDKTDGSTENEENDFVPKWFHYLMYFAQIIPDEVYVLIGAIIGFYIALRFI